MLSVKVWIDAGHGGQDSGATGNGLKEKDILLALSNRIVSILKTRGVGVEVNTTRSTDVYVSLDERANRANAWGADFFFSNHINAGGGTGFESYIYTSPSSASINYQNIIHGELKAFYSRYNMRDRGKKRANFAVLRQTKMPAILFEHLFIDTPADAALLAKDSFLDALALAVAEALAKALGFQIKEEIPVPSEEIFYRVIVSSNKIRANAEADVAKAKQCGFPDAFIDIYKK
ncbi:N-acetylmuramoyl-L-alanine amidase [Bacillus sp. 165]|uniref:N-acetylmuramoyl-L-alanine amidase n=1 Tax=Bacillus sp. 165 TaxID=1529117 RepID=UPI001ADD0486|nr:N-acetylmuramoyl-L-alanine amidase [Bacillus sp. 165]MBO9129063.1 N-acetylmuramoyl-L-alanine amidase [Bacillus sp. 165]